jgi:hypothetical protein
MYWLLVFAINVGQGRLSRLVWKKLIGTSNNVLGYPGALYSSHVTIAWRAGARLHKHAGTGGVWAGAKQKPFSALSDQAREVVLAASFIV